jgi:hypothetical protein
LNVPVYCDLKVESISSMGIERAVLVATFFTSSGRMIGISMLYKGNVKDKSLKYNVNNKNKKRT